MLNENLRNIINFIFYYLKSFVNSYLKIESQVATLMASGAWGY